MRFLRLKGFFGDGPANAANRVFPRLTLVAMGTKFWTKWAITRHMYELSPRLCIICRIFAKNWLELG